MNTANLMQYFWYDNKVMQVFICKINLRKLEYYKCLTFKHINLIAYGRDLCKARQVLDLRRQISYSGWFRKPPKYLKT